MVAPLGVLLSLGSRSMANEAAMPIWMYLHNWKTTVAFVDFPEFRSDLLNAGAGLFTVYLILVCWSWASGFLIGALSRLAVPAHGALFCLAVLIPGLWDQPNLVARGPNAAIFSLTFYGVMFPFIVQAVLVLLPAVRGMRHGLGLAAFPRPLRAIQWACAIVTVAALVVMNLNWVLCLIGPFHSAGRYQACMEWVIQAGAPHVWGHSPIVRIPTLPLALAGPVGYLAAASVWRRWRGDTAWV